MNFDCESYYRERDNRTDLVLPQPPFPVPLALTIDPVWAETLDGQLCLYWLSSLTARMGQRYNQLQLWLTPALVNIPCRIPGLQEMSLAAAIITHLRSADPCGAYGVVERPADGSLVVAVGDLPGGAQGAIVRPLGWSAVIAPSGLLPPAQIGEGQSNPIGAALAASLGAAEIYLRCNETSLPGRVSQIPLWISARRSAVTQSAEEAARWQDEAPLPGVVELGRCMVVGAGALGGNALLILAAIRDRLRGRIDIVDHDRVDVSNLNRLIAALLGHRGVFKAELARLCFQGSAVDVVPHTISYERLRARRGAGSLAIEDYDLILTGVDQMATRAFVQSDWPRYLINGGTRGYSWRVSTHSIEPENACLGCLAGKGQQQYRDLVAPLACGAGMPGRPVQAAPPMDSYSFVSFFGATFMVARAIERALGLNAMPVQSLSTEAVALNLTALRNEPDLPSGRCLCRCSHPVVRDYRASKYGGGLR